MAKLKSFQTTLVTSKPSFETDLQNEKSLKHKSMLTNNLKIYFDFTYYLGASPFHFVMDKDLESFYIESSRAHQVLCGLLHILCIFRLISQIRESIPDISKLRISPAPYFEIVLGFCGLFYKLTTMKRFWLNKNEYLKIVNFILREINLPVKDKLFTRSYFSYVLFGFSVVKIYASFISGYNFVIPIWNWTPSWWFQRLVAQGRFVFCFENSPGIMEAPELNDITFWDWILAVLIGLAQLQRWILGDFCDHCILASALTLWSTASSFSDKLKERLLDNEEILPEQTEMLNIPSIIIIQSSAQQNNENQLQEWSKIYTSFQAIRKLSQMINCALGTQVIWYMAEGIMYYSFSLNTIFLTKDEFRRLHQLVFYFVTFSILWFSADICSKMESIKLWLTRNNNARNVPSDEVSLVLHEMVIKDIGIRGSDLFTITFSLVAKFLSLIVTFFVICVQDADAWIH